MDGKCIPPCLLRCARARVRTSGKGGTARVFVHLRALIGPRIASFLLPSGERDFRESQHNMAPTGTGSVLRPLKSAGYCPLPLGGFSFSLSSPSPATLHVARFPRGGRPLFPGVFADAAATLPRRSSLCFPADSTSHRRLPFVKQKPRTKELTLRIYKTKLSPLQSVYTVSIYFSNASESVPNLASRALTRSDRKPRNNDGGTSQVRRESQVTVARAAVTNAGDSLIPNVQGNTTNRPHLPYVIHATYRQNDADETFPYFL